MVVWGLWLTIPSIFVVSARTFKAPSTVERWGIFEATFEGPASGNPFVDVKVEAAFTSGATRMTIRGFYDGSGSYKVRFSPPATGDWSYTTSSNAAALQGHSGKFTVVSNSPDQHGPAQADGHSLRFADKTPYFSVGSTSYQWASMPREMQENTLKTLKQGQGNGQVFNKQRMTIFPKWYVYNHQNPVDAGAAYEIIPGSDASNESKWNCFGPQCPALSGSFDLTRFNVSFWQNFEHLLWQMREMGVIADIILFHPYDGGHWGFDCMGGRNQTEYNTTNDKFYLRYVGARLSAFSNVWWSMANEWDCWNSHSCKGKGVSRDNGPSPVWNELFQELVAADPYRRMTGIHNGRYLYNHSQPWITHVSLQGRESETPQLRAFYGKPVIWDEVQYEGDIKDSWGRLSGEEMADRFWWGSALGVYVGHSETVIHPDMPDDDHQPLWWAKGGTLIGQSPQRLQWFRSLWEGNSSRPSFGTQTYSALNNSGGTFAHQMSSNGYVFLRLVQAGLWKVPLPTTAPKGWVVRELDYWNMTVTAVKDVAPTAQFVMLQASSAPYHVEIVSKSATILEPLLV